MEKNLGYKKANRFFKYIGIILLIIFAGGACYVGYVNLSKFLDKDSKNDTPTTTTTVANDKVIGVIKKYENKGYKKVNLDIDLSENLKKNNGSEYSLTETKKITDSFKSSMLKITLTNGNMKLYDISSNEEKQVQEIKDVKEINYYEDTKCSYILFSYLITKDNKVYVLNVENSVEGMMFEEKGNNVYERIELYTKKINHLCGRTTFKLIGTDESKKLYDIFNKNSVEAEDDIKEKSGYFENREVYINGEKQEYKVKLLGVGRMDDVTLIVGSDDNLYDIEGKKINSKKVSAIMVNEESFKIAYIYEDGNVNYMEETVIGE